MPSDASAKQMIFWNWRPHPRQVQPSQMLHMFAVVRVVLFDFGLLHSGPQTTDRSRWSGLFFATMLRGFYSLYRRMFFPRLNPPFYELNFLHTQTCFLKSIRDANCIRRCYRYLCVRSGFCFILRDSLLGFRCLCILF